MLNEISLGELNATIAAMQADPTLAKMSFSARSEWQSGTKNKLSKDGFSPIYSDEPVEFGGKNTAPTPGDYLLMAAAGCYSTAFEIIATQAGVEIKHLSVDITSEINVLDLFDSSYFEELLVQVSIEADADTSKIEEIAQAALNTSFVLRNLRGNKTLVINSLK